MAISGEYPYFPRIDVEDYLTLDTTSKTAKYEYLEGEVTMLAGSSSTHAIITMNMGLLLGNALRKTPCVVYSSDARVKLAEDKYVHPDITISCEKEDRKPKDGNIQSPKIIVEVLSPSTESVDRGKKLQYYINYPTLQEYILIDSKKQSVEIYSKKGEEWTRKMYGPKMNVEVSSIHLVFPIEEIYEKTILLDEL